MTAETLKPFIALPNQGSTYTEPKRNVTLIVIWLSTILSVVCFSLAGFVIYNSIRVHQLNTEVESLKVAIDNLQKRLGLDYLDELSDFEEAYNHSSLDDLKPGSQDFLDSAEDHDVDDDFDQDDGSAEYEFSDEHLDTDWDPMNQGDYDDTDIYDDDEDDYITERKQRSIQSNISPPQAHDIIISNKENIRDIDSHKIIKFSPKGDVEEKLDISMIDSSIPQQKHVHLTKPLQTKNSVSHTGRPTKKRNARRLLKNGSRQKNAYSERLQVGHPHVVAIHYALNATHSSQGNHPHHEANARLLHDGDVYVGHVPPWVRELGMDRSFEINNGVIKIQESGIYYVYAQVYYHNHMDRNGFFVYHNSHPLLQCALTVPTNTLKGNTCFTSGVAHFQKDDTIHLRDLFKDRVVTLRGAKSFFGMIKLGTISRH